MHYGGYKEIKIFVIQRISYIPNVGNIKAKKNLLISDQ